MTGHDLLLAMAMEGGPVIISQYIEVHVDKVQYYILQQIWNVTNMDV